MKNFSATLMAVALLALPASQAVADRAAYSGVVDSASGKQLFDKPVPAITYLWISRDSHYIVGLSNIKYQNQYQLIVLSDSGQELLKQDLTSVDWARRTASVTNWLNWYKEPEPKIVLTTATRTLEIEDASGVMRTFQL